MALFPLVERELRAASRRGRTYWLRSLVALAACVICAWVSLVSTRGQQELTMGKSLFNLLSALGFAYALLVGPFLTADAISEEKRDGTLGLLFLTTLRSWQVVAGKWLASSLAGFLGLLAILPSLGIPLLFGGVTPGEYGRMALGVVNAIFFSLSAGMFVSMLSRDQGRATLGTVVLVLGIAGMLPGLVVFLGNITLGIPVAKLELVALISPAWAGYKALDKAFLAAPQQYWLSLGISHGLSWVFLAATAVIMPRIWRDQVPDRPVTRRWVLRLGYTRGWRRAFRRRCERNPVYAAAARRRWPHWVFWGLVTLVAVNVYWLTFGYRSSPGSTKFHQNFAYALVFTNRVWVAVMACHVVLDARRTGALELLLTTPLRARTFLRGHWRALRHYFFWPIVAIALLHVFYVVGNWSAISARTAVGTTYLLTSSVNAAGSFVNFLSDVVALCFVGTWLSVSMRRPSLAILVTLLLVILLPFAASRMLPTLQGLLPGDLVAFLAGLPGLRLLSRNLYSMRPVVHSVVWVGKNLLFVFWARSQLKRHFRRAAAQTHGWDRPGKRWWQRWQRWGKPDADAQPAEAMARTG
jgi:ABC-type transport system involved in multi-copper enzyme maturation permease subunit